MAQTLFEGWVEMVHQQAYRAVMADQTQKLYTEVLYISLDEDFMPTGKSPLQLALRAGQEISSAQLFLEQFRRLAGGEEGKHPLESIGWLLQFRGRPGLVLCWDEFIPHARYQQYWDLGLPGKVVRRQANTLILKILSSAWRDGEVRYEALEPGVEALEIEALEPGDRVRFWPDLNGQRFLLPEAPISAYILRKQKVWDRRDKYAYELDPISIG
jgi:hypothetical protein